MKRREEILDVLKRKLPYLRDKFNVKNVGLFGSCARGEQTGKSDVDLLVEFESPIGFFEFIELEDYLSEILKAKVEIVTPDALKPLMKPFVLREVVYA